MRKSVLFCILLLPFLLNAQAPCLPGTPGADNCADACFMCSLSTYSGSTVGYAQSNTPGYCGTIENDQFLGVIAADTFVKFTLTSTYCEGINGVQMAVYESCTGNPIACVQGQSGGADIPVFLNAHLTIGQKYILFIDGYAGDQCDFTLEVFPPTAFNSPQLNIPTEISGPDTLCRSGSAVYSIPAQTNGSFFTWTGPPGTRFNGQLTPVSIDDPSGNQVLVSLPDSAISSAEICVTTSDFCGESASLCTTIVVDTNNIAVLTTLPPVHVCANDSVYHLPWDGSPVYTSGLYSINLTPNATCDSTLTQQVIFDAPIETFMGNFYPCYGECFDFNGQSYCEYGTFSTIFQSTQGCDSTVSFFVYPLTETVEIIASGSAIYCQFPQLLLNLDNPYFPSYITWTHPSGQTVTHGNSFFYATEPGEHIACGQYGSPHDGCIQCDTFEVFSFINPPVLISSFISPASPGVANGAIMMEVGGGVGPYTFTWTQDGQIISHEMNLTNLSPGTYSCLVENADHCTAVFTFVVTETVETTAPESEGGWRLYPNPNTGTFKAVSDGDMTPTEWRLYDVMGRLVKTAFFPASAAISVEWSDLPTGTYYLKIQGNNSLNVFKLSIIAQ